MREGGEKEERRRREGGEKEEERKEGRREGEEGGEQREGEMKGEEGRRRRGTDLVVFFAFRLLIYHKLSDKNTQPSQEMPKC